MSWRENVSRNKIIKGLASLKLATALLLILFFLTFFGTLHQVEFGLLDAQQRYFNSLFFFAMKWIPMPGARLVFIVLALSLVVYNVVYLRYTWRNVGLAIIHWVIVFFLISFFVTYHFSRNGYMTLSEGAASFFMRHPYNWDFVVYSKKNFSDTKKLSLKDLKENSSLTVNEVKIHINKIEKNAKLLYIPEEDIKRKVLSVSGKNVFVVDKSKRDAQKYVPAMEVSVGEDVYVLYGDDDEPIKLNDETSLRIMQETETLPIGVRLLDVKQESYENTGIAKNYESLVEITEKNGLSRKTKILMNEPYRYKGYSIFQNGYYLDPTYQTEYSTFEIVYNPFYQLPYWLTLILMLGCALHFVVIFSAYMKKSKKTEK